MVSVEREADAVFLDTCEPKLDGKGRLILPTKLRDQLQRGLVITRGQEHCLFVFTIEELEEFQTRLHQAPPISKEVCDYQRVPFSGVNDQVPNKQERISIPSNLCEYVRLEHDLVVTSSGGGIEIWDLTAWDECLNTQEAAFTDRGDGVIPGPF